MGWVQALEHAAARDQGWVDIGQAAKIRQGQNRGGRARTRADCSVRYAGSSACAVYAALRQWLGFHQSQLYGAGAQLWLALGVHHAALPAAERHDRARHPQPQGAMRASASLRAPAARQSSRGQLDQLLQPTASTHQALAMKTPAAAYRDFALAA